VHDVFNHTDLLGSQPELGRQVPELLGLTYREVIFGSYRIIYKVDNEIKILTIRNSRQLLSLDNIE
jgi:plasmid stabilization system protein ParE